MKTKSSLQYSNNFDFIRIIAASMVLYSHHFALTGQMEPAFLGLYSVGGLAVYIFFIISGYLVMTSWWRDPNFFRFSVRRILRIWPALTCVVVATAYLLGPIVTELPLGQYLRHGGTSEYLRMLVMQTPFVLPGVFTHNPFAHGVNGSLWTIPFEVRCYIALGLIGAIGLLKTRAFALLCVGILLGWFLVRSNPDATGTFHSGRMLSAFFTAGVAVCSLEKYWSRRPHVWAVAVVIAALISWSLGWRYTSMLIALPYLVIYLGVQATPFLRQAGRWGDPSYGIYLLAFPVQQTTIFYLWPQAGFWGTLCIAYATTVVLAYASWHLIEKRALKFKPRTSKSNSSGAEAS